MVTTTTGEHDEWALILPQTRMPQEQQPGDRPPAPGELALVQAFVNTFWDLAAHGAEQLSSPGALRAWLVARRLLEPNTELDEADLERALAVREGLRALLFANNGAAFDPDAIERLNAELRGPGLHLQLHPTAQPVFRRAQDDLDAALASLATIVAVAQIDGHWPRLKACPGTECGWAFYDHSRNQNSSWCSMSICGSRAKARKYRKRNRGE